MTFKEHSEASKIFTEKYTEWSLEMRKEMERQEKIEGWSINYKTSISSFWFPNPMYAKGSELGDVW